ncbi:hypothetical protein PR202_gb12486 [Eleusine coracana subsp. coracana]|uniref:Uncharacterized protein n=1 Tax=Eleusine coracana subsp. coracana TaxID=191504 RepID=A0AAV5EQN3_ELECO|nr:hypothetical protein PR202_gb12486 [Eleusine coracana subsp. coracana]
MVNFWGAHGEGVPVVPATQNGGPTAAAHLSTSSFLLVPTPSHSPRPSTPRTRRAHPFTLSLSRCFIRARGASGRAALTVSLPSAFVSVPVVASCRKERKEEERTNQPPETTDAAGEPPME